MTTLPLTTDVDALRKSHDEASAVLRPLDAELTSIPGALRAAAEAGNADAYVALLARQDELPARIKIARLAFAQTGLDLYRALLAEAEQAQEQPAGPVSAIETGGLMHVPVSADVRLLQARVDGLREAVDEARRALFG